MMSIQQFLLLSIVWLSYPTVCHAFRAGNSYTYERTTPFSKRQQECLCPITRCQRSLATSQLWNQIEGNERINNSMQRINKNQSEDNRELEINSTLRRQILSISSTTALSSLPFPTTLQPPKANAAETTAEAIRIASSQTIPGLGPPDIYYPSYFIGKWRVTRLITTSEDAMWKGISLPAQIVHEMRFVPYDAFRSNSKKEGDYLENGDGGNGGDGIVPAIADRAFNERSYYAELSAQLNKLVDLVPDRKTMPSLQTVDWTPTNPNVLSLGYADGSSKEVKVTKRSSDVSKDGSSVFSTEFRRVTVVPAVSDGNKIGGIPSIYGSRLLTKWKKASVSNNDKDSANDSASVDFIEGIEILYNEQGTLGDAAGGQNMPSLYGNNSKDLADWRSTKTKILMERIK